MQTERMRLRRFQLSDFSNMRGLESDPDVVKFTPMLVPLSEEKTRERLAALVSKEAANEPFGVWAAELKDSGAFVGWFMLSRPSEQAPAELGFMILQSLWGQGLTTEAAQYLIDHGFNQLGLKRISAKTVPANLASEAILKKLGFKSISGVDPAINYFELNR